MKKIREKALSILKTFAQYPLAVLKTIRRDDLELHVDAENKIRLYFKGVELTKSAGFSGAVLSEGVWHGLSETNIKISRIARHKMGLFIKFKKIPLIQHWIIELAPGNQINWNIEIEAEKPMRIDAVRTILFFSKYYRVWFDAKARENLFPGFLENSKTCYETKELDFIGLKSEDPQVPSFTFKATGVPFVLSIQNTGIELSSRVLEIRFEDGKELYQPGIYPYFKSDFQLYPDRTVLESILIKIRQEEEHRRQSEERQRITEAEQRRQAEENKQLELKRKRLEEEEQRRQAEENKQLELERKRREEDQKLRTLKKGVLMLYFDLHNRFHVYYKDYEITKGIGLRAGIFSEGNWYCSSDSQVKIERPSDDEMVIYFSHSRIPVVQTWQLRFAAEDIVEWEVNISIKEPLRIDQRIASLFLSKAYKGWIAPSQEGQFPSIFGNEWQMMDKSRGDKSDFIGLYSSQADLPGIVFKSVEDLKCSLVIQNTDMEHSSRVLEIQFEEEKELQQPGVYPYLKARFQIYPDKTILEDIRVKIKQEEEQRRQAEELQRMEEEERRKQEEKQKKHEERLKLLQEKIKKVYVEPGEITELAALREEYIKNDSSIYIYGDTEDLHDKISLGQRDFKESVSRIKLAVSENIKIKIGISRFNFFKLHEIVQFCSSLMNQRLDLRSVILNPLPLKRLYANFFEYLKELKERSGVDRIEFFLKDEKLLNLLYFISSQANQYNERELLRLLGVISEHAFIGPQTIVLDTFHRCNTNCIHCWIHTPERKLSEELINLKMDLSLYKSIVDDAVGLLCDEIIIQGDGEPLLDDRFLEMVQYARDKGLKVIFFTNAILLDEKKAQRIIELEIDEIYCSLPAGTDKTYAAINTMQTEETFHKITDNLKKLIGLRDRSKRNKPKLQMTHVVHDLNHHELEEMARVDAYIGADKARFYLARLDENIEFLKIKPDHLEVIKNSLSKVAIYLNKQRIELQNNIWFQLENYNSATGRWSKDKLLELGCPVGWFFCLILARGELSMCCHLRIVDCLGDKSFKEAWNSGTYDKFRIQAKHIMENKDSTFRNGVKLYDEYCNNCDTHQVILRINELLKKYNLEQFYKDSPI